MNILFLLILFPAFAHAKSEYHGIIGMDITNCDAEITSLSGQDTDHAQLTAKFTRDLAMSNCSGSHFAPDKACINSCLKSTKGKIFTVSADCINQKVTSALGKTFQFKGVKENVGATGWGQGFSRQEWEDLATNNLVNDGSDNWHIRSAFEKLCPTSFSSIQLTEKNYEKPFSYDTNTTLPKPLSNSTAHFRITRFFKSSTDFYGIVFSVSTPVTVKCVINDPNNTPLAVETFKLSPPAEEVIMRYTGSDASSNNVQCHKQD